MRCSRVTIALALVSALAASPVLGEKLIVEGEGTHTKSALRDSEAHSGENAETEVPGTSESGTAESESIQQTEYQKGRIDGKEDAESDPGYLWFLAGLGCGCLGVGAAYLTEPSVPSEKLVGKSPEYVFGYSEAYKETAGNLRISRAGIGCLITTIGSLIWLGRESEDWEFPFSSGNGCWHSM